MRVFMHMMVFNEPPEVLSQISKKEMNKTKKGLSFTKMMNMLEVEKNAEGKVITKAQEEKEKEDNKNRIEYIDNMVKITRKDMQDTIVDSSNMPKKRRNRRSKKTPEGFDDFVNQPL